MSRKMECPGCEAYTSGVVSAFEEQKPCPYCGLPFDAAEAVLKARERGASDELIKRVTDAETRAAKAEREARMLRIRLNDIKRLVNSDMQEPVEW